MLISDWSSDVCSSDLLMLMIINKHLEFVLWDRTWSWNILIPLIVLGLFIVLVLIYPFIEAWITGDKREHHIAQRPRNAATRNAIGAAGEIGRAHVLTPVTNAHLVCRLLLEKKNTSN